MTRRTLIDFFEDLSRISGEFLVFDDGYRTWSLTYRQTTDQARAFAARLHAEGIVQGQHVVVWGENRPEWIVALWGCLLRGVVLVPIDYRASIDFLQRVARIVDARAVLVLAVVALADEAARPTVDLAAHAAPARSRF